MPDYYWSGSCYRGELLSDLRMRDWLKLPRLDMYQGVYQILPPATFADDNITPTRFEDDKSAPSSWEKEG